MMQTNNFRDPTPGLTSPLVWGPFALATGLLLMGNNATHYNGAIYLLAISGTALFTNNPPARLMSVVGGVMRVCSSPMVSAFGFFAQTAALGYAVIESVNTTPPEAPQHR